jgi:hypothetical protein
MQERMTCARKPMLLAASLSATLLSACTNAGGSATEQAICRELRADLPTWSRSDTAETLEAGARFVTVFDAICGSGQ